MIIELFEALLDAMKFRDINPDRICRVDGNVGFIWFKAGGITYYVSIHKAEFDLEEYANE